MRENPESASMAGIARAAGVSRQAVYLHFENRAGLLLALVRWIDEEERIVERFEAAGRGLAAKPRLRAYVELWLNYLPSLQPVPYYLAHARQDAAARAAWDDRMQLMEALYREPLAEMHDAGQLPRGMSVEQAVDCVMTVASVFAWEQLTQDKGWSATLATTTLWRAVAAVLQPEDD